MLRDRFVLAATALCLCAFAAAFVAIQASSPRAEAQPVAVASCGDAEVVMIALHRDPRLSRATLRAKDGSTWSQRPGQNVQGRTLETIAVDRVVLSQGESTCELRVGRRSHPEPEVAALVR